MSGRLGSEARSGALAPMIDVLDSVDLVGPPDVPEDEGYLFAGRSVGRGRVDDVGADTGDRADATFLDLHREVLLGGAVARGSRPEELVRGLDDLVVAERLGEQWAGLVDPLVMRMGS